MFLSGGQGCPLFPLRRCISSSYNKGEGGQLMATAIDIRELPARLDEALALASAGGEVILLDGSNPRARLRAFGPGARACGRAAPRGASARAGFRCAAARRILGRTAMKLLLDTHAFIWWDSDPAQLSAPALAALRDPANETWLSVASVWEMVI